MGGTTGGETEGDAADSAKGQATRMERPQLEVKGKVCGEEGQSHGGPEDQRRVERQSDGWKIPASRTNAESGSWGKDTSGRAEAIELVLIVVGSGGTPAVVIRAPVGGAGRVGAALEGEWKYAGLAVCIAELGVESWGGPHSTPSLLIPVLHPSSPHFTVEETGPREEESDLQATQH